MIDTGLQIVASGIDFVRSYTNKSLANVPDDATSDRRAATLNQKTGGDRGAAALDAGNVLVAASADFTRAYTGKSLANVPDDATSDRRAATADEKTGGSRGFSVIDTGLQIVAAGIDFVRAYTNKHMGNVPDDATTDRRAATANQKTGGDRGAAAIDAGNIAVAAAVDLSRSYTNKHLGNIPDDASSDRKAVTTNEKTGAGRAYPALDASNKLITGVTSAATADDGTQIESIKRAKIKSARGAGAGAQGLSAAYARRTGEGGTASAPFKTGHLYSDDGARPLIDTASEQILSDLAIGPGVRAASNFALGGAVKYSPNRHNDQQTAQDGDAKSFAISYDGIPQMRAIPQSMMTFRAASSGVDQKVDCRATAVTVAGYTARAKIVTGETSSPATNDFAASLNGTPVGAGVALSADAAAAYCNLASADTDLTTYTVVFDVDTTGMDPANIVSVLVYRNDGASSTSWTLVASTSYDSGVNGTGFTLQFAAALAVNWDVRLLISYDQAPGASTATITAQQVDYQVVIPGLEYDATAGATDSVLFQAMEAP